MKNSGDADEGKLNKSVIKKSKVIQVQRNLFNLIQAETKLVLNFKPNKRVTSITIRTPVLRAAERRSVVRITPKASEMKGHKLFPSRNHIQVNIQKVTSKFTKQSMKNSKTVAKIEEKQEKLEKPKIFEATNSKSTKREQIESALCFLREYAGKLRQLEGDKSKNKQDVILKTKKVTACKGASTAESTPVQENGNKFRYNYAVPVATRKQSKQLVKGRWKSIGQFMEQTKNSKNELLEALEKLALEPLIK